MQKEVGTLASERGPVAQPAFASSAGKPDIAQLRQIGRENSVRAGTTAPAMLGEPGHLVHHEAYLLVRKPTARKPKSFRVPARSIKTIPTNVGAGVFSRAFDSSRKLCPAIRRSAARLRRFSSCHLRWKQRTRFVRSDLPQLDQSHDDRGHTTVMGLRNVIEIHSFV